MRMRQEMNRKFGRFAEICFIEIYYLRLLSANISYRLYVAWPINGLLSYGVFVCVANRQFFARPSAMAVKMAKPARENMAIGATVKAMAVAHQAAQGGGLYQRICIRPGNFARPVPVNTCHLDYLRKARQHRHESYVMYWLVYSRKSQSLS